MTAISGNSDDLLTAASSMTQAIKSLSEEIGGVKIYSQQTRRLARVLIVSVIFDILLSVGLYLGFRKADDASSKATKASSKQIVACTAANASNDIQTKLWNIVLNFPAPVGETQEAKEQRLEQTSQFKQYIQTAFAQKDCTKAG